jgi:hypothetical protein
MDNNAFGINQNPDNNKKDMLDNYNLRWWFDTYIAQHAIKGPIKDG